MAVTGIRKIEIDGSRPVVIQLPGSAQSKSWDLAWLDRLYYLFYV
jgi:hypothetical protein